MKINDFELYQYYVWRTRDKREFYKFHCGENYIEELKNLDNGTYSNEIHISGLNQKSFEYFIENYGERFKIIEFIQCKQIQDFTSLMKLEQIEYILIDYNTKATSLWNMENNKALKGLQIVDTWKVINLKDVKTAPNLEELWIEEGIDSAMGSNRYNINSLVPLMECEKLKRLKISVNKIIDDKIDPLMKMKSLEKLYLALDLFELEQYAKFVATVENIQITPNVPYYEGEEQVLVVGRGRRNLTIHSPKLKLLQQEWDTYITKYSDYRKNNNKNRTD